MIRRQDLAIGGGGTDLGIAASAIIASTIDVLPMHNQLEGGTKPRKGQA